MQNDYKTLSKEKLKQFEKILYQKARDVDVSFYNCLFYEDDIELLLTALSMYQNEDGGFGRNLDVDNLNPNSTPITTYLALNYLYEAGLKKEDLEDYYLEMINNTFIYLFEKAPFENNKWPMTVPSNNDYACASWFKHSADSNNIFNPTAAIIAFGILFLDVNNMYYKKCISLVDDVIDYYLGLEEVEKHIIGVYNILVEVLQNNNINPNKFNQLKEKLFTDAKNIVCDKDHFSSDYPNFPLELFREYQKNIEINELIDDNLDYLLETRKTHGLWECNWKWGNNYPEQDIAYLKAVGYVSVNYILYLKRFNRIENALQS